MKSVFGRFKPGLKFIKFGHRVGDYKEKPGFQELLTLFSNFLDLGWKVLNLLTNSSKKCPKKKRNSQNSLFYSEIYFRYVYSIIKFKTQLLQKIFGTNLDQHIGYKH